MCLWLSVSTWTVGVIILLFWYMLIKLCCETLWDLSTFLHADWSSEFLGFFYQYCSSQNQAFALYFSKRHYHHWITIEDRWKIIWFGGVRLCCHFLFHVIFLSLYCITHRVFPGGFSTKGVEPAKPEFSLLVLPRWFSKFEGAERYLHC